MMLLQVKDCQKTTGSQGEAWDRSLSQPSEKPTLSTPPSWTSRLRNRGTIRFCCFSYIVCGTFVTGIAKWNLKNQNIVPSETSDFINLSLAQSIHATLSFPQPQSMNRICSYWHQKGLLQIPHAEGITTPTLSLDKQNLQCWCCPGRSESGEIKPTWRCALALSCTRSDFAHLSPETVI